MQKILNCVFLAAVAATGNWASAQSPAPAAALIGQSWRFATRPPADGWDQPGFDDASWSMGAGGLGTPGTPGARVGTRWDTPDIWLRKAWTAEQPVEQPLLLIHHDEDAEVSLNGRRIATLRGFTVAYRAIPLTAEQAGWLVAGRNVLAVHCHQTGGGQYIDAHVMAAADLPVARPFPSKLVTPWGEQVTAENAWSEYPRPQLARPQWTNLNGWWQYAIAPGDAEQPTRWKEKILVPFCLESRLSGVGRLLEPNQALWYRRELSLAPRAGHRLLLHFEAVDYRCRAWLNGREIGQHVGGNLPFTFDLTEAAVAGDNELIVQVHDATEGTQLRGKQTLDPQGIWYTRASGIWQTAWVEAVPATYLVDLQRAFEIVNGQVQLRPRLNQPLVGGTLQATASLDGVFAGRSEETPADGAASLAIKIANPKLWSPKSPTLYDLKVVLRDQQGAVVDEVDSYLGLRQIGKHRDSPGHWRLTLNGQELFQLGPLDQGWWPDGLLTPPSDAAMQFEIEFLRAAGFNMIRKHIKVEPRRYYHHCDRLGMLVWQDQVSGGAGPPWTRLDANPQDATWTDSDHQQYMTELQGTIDLLGVFPCVVAWTPFNEAWGQHRTLEVGEWTSRYDGSRLVNIASGGNFWPVGDLVDHHEYPHPAFPRDDARWKGFVKVVGEFGGHGWPTPGHLWDDQRENWGYGDLPKSLAEWKSRYRESIERLAELKAKGIAAGVYTQTTDVEGEINGLMTYDRRVMKMSSQELREINRQLGHLE